MDMHWSRSPRPAAATLGAQPWTPGGWSGPSRLQPSAVDVFTFVLRCFFYRVPLIPQVVNPPRLPRCSRRAAGRPGPGKVARWQGWQGGEVGKVGKVARLARLARGVAGGRRGLPPARSCCSGPPGPAQPWAPRPRPRPRSKVKVKTKAKVPQGPARLRGRGEKVNLKKILPKKK